MTAMTAMTAMPAMPAAGSTARPIGPHQTDVDIAAIKHLVRAAESCINIARNFHMDLHVRGRKAKERESDKWCMYVISGREVCDKW